MLFLTLRWKTSYLSVELNVLNLLQESQRKRVLLQMQEFSQLFRNMIKTMMKDLISVTF